MCLENWATDENSGGTIKAEGRRCFVDGGPEWLRCEGAHGDIHVIDYGGGVWRPDESAMKVILEAPAEKRGDVALQICLESPSKGVWTD